MIHESSGDRQEPLFAQTPPIAEVADVVSVPVETPVDATVIPDDQTSSSPTPAVHEKGDWEKFSEGKGPYPWHLV
ncbi:MAG TPA: hypothetical protein PKA02_02450 [Candidatus Saccharibacteria bacterium]|nr:hypothetical protein [Candidatus Saccharibacteria bacterium]